MLNGYAIHMPSVIICNNINKEQIMGHHDVLMQGYVNIDFTDLTSLMLTAILGLKFLHYFIVHVVL